MTPTQQPESETSDSWDDEYTIEEDKNQDSNDPLSQIISFECMDEVKNADLWSGYLQIADMIFRVDGSMTMGEAIEQLKKSEIQWKYDFSEDDIVTTDSEYTIGFGEQNLITIKAVKNSSDDFVPITDLMITYVDAGDIAWYPQGISKLSDVSVKEIAQYLDDKSFYRSTTDQDVYASYDLEAYPMQYFLYTSPESGYAISYPYKNSDLNGYCRGGGLTIYFDEKLHITEISPYESFTYSLEYMSHEPSDLVNQIITQAESDRTGNTYIASAHDITASALKPIIEDAKNKAKTQDARLLPTFDDLISSDENNIEEILVVNEEYDGPEKGRMRIIFNINGCFYFWDFPPVTITPDGSLTYAKNRMGDFCVNGSDDWGLKEAESINVNLDHNWDQEYGKEIPDLDELPHIVISGDEIR